MPRDWKFQPLVFIPQDLHPRYKMKVKSLPDLGEADKMPTPKVVYLESVAPWKYSWNRTAIEFAPDGD